MYDPTNNAGISKNSTLIVDLPDYPPTSGQLTMDITQNTTGTGFTTLYPQTEIQQDYFSSVRYRVNVATKQSIVLNDIKYNGNSIGWNHQPINWSHTAVSNINQKIVGFCLYKIANENYYIGIATISNGERRSFSKPDEAIGDYMRESFIASSNVSRVIGIVINGIQIYYNDDTITTNNSWTVIRLTDYIITDF